MQSVRLWKRTFTTCQTYMGTNTTGLNLKSVFFNFSAFFALESHIVSEFRLEENNAYEFELKVFLLVRFWNIFSYKKHQTSSWKISLKNQSLQRKFTSKNLGVALTSCVKTTILPFCVLFHKAWFWSKLFPRESEFGKSFFIPNQILK